MEDGESSLVISQMDQYRIQPRKLYLETEFWAGDFLRRVFFPLCVCMCVCRGLYLVFCFWCFFCGGSSKETCWRVHLLFLPHCWMKLYPNSMPGALIAENSILTEISVYVNGSFFEPCEEKHQLSAYSRHAENKPVKMLASQETYPGCTTSSNIHWRSLLHYWYHLLLSSKSKCESFKAYNLL